MEDESILQKHKSGSKKENSKGSGLGWTHSSDDKLARALGYCLLVSVRWRSLAVLAYQFKSRILLYPCIKILGEQFPWACKAEYLCVLYRWGRGILLRENSENEWNPGGICSATVFTFSTWFLMLSLLEGQCLPKSKGVKTSPICSSQHSVWPAYLVNWFIKLNLLSYTLSMLAFVVRIGFVFLWAPQQHLMMHQDIEKWMCTVEIHIFLYYGNIT